MIHVSRKNLDKSYKHLKQESKKNTANGNAKLLLFVYAIECGLKSLLLKRKQIKDTYKFVQNEGENSLNHDLRSLLTKLYSRHRLPENIQFKTRSSASETVPLSDLHQALRYGGTFSNPEEKNSIEKKLYRIDSWLQEELAQ